MNARRKSFAHGPPCHRLTHRLLAPHLKYGWRQALSVVQNAPSVPAAGVPAQTPPLHESPDAHVLAVQASPTLPAAMHTPTGPQISGTQVLLVVHA